MSASPTPSTRNAMMLRASSRSRGPYNRQPAGERCGRSSPACSYTRSAFVETPSPRAASDARTNSVPVPVAPTRVYMATIVGPAPRAGASAFMSVPSPAAMEPRTVACLARSPTRRGWARYRDRLSYVDDHAVFAEFNRTGIVLSYQRKCRRRHSSGVVGEHRQLRLDLLEDRSGLRGICVMLDNRLQLAPSTATIGKPLVQRPGEARILLRRPHFVNQQVSTLRKLDQVVRPPRVT